jgi:branched-chain amino acid transport system substrate-binding protein
LTEASTSEKPVEILKLGATVNLGDRLGIQMKRCFELLAEQLNESGGLAVQGKKYNVKVIVYDDKYQADAGRAAFERLVFQDNVKVIFSYGSAPTLAGVELTEPNKVLLLHAAISSQLLHPKYNYTFHTRAGTTGVFSTGVFIKKHLNPQLKTVVVLANDDLTGYDMAKHFGAMWRNCNIKVVDTLYYKRGTVDLNPLGVKVRSLNPDIVHFDGMMPGAETLRVFKAIYQSGWRGQIFAELALTTVPDIVNACGKESVEGMFVQFLDPTVVPNPPPLAMPFRRAYTAKYGIWETDALRWFDGWYYFVSAVKKANSLDVNDIVRVIQGLSVETVLGESRMCRRPDLGNNKYVDISTTLHMGQVRNGEGVYLDRVLPIEGIRMAKIIYGGGEWE